jgi:hypothetical protein
VKSFYADFDTRLAEAPFVAGNTFSAADITALVTVDFWQSLLLSYYPTSPGDRKAVTKPGMLNIPDQANTMKVSTELVRHNVPIGWYRR